MISVTTVVGPSTYVAELVNHRLVNIYHGRHKAHIADALWDDQQLGVILWKGTPCSGDRERGMALQAALSKAFLDIIPVRTVPVYIGGLLCDIKVELTVGDSGIARAFLGFRCIVIGDWNGKEFINAEPTWDGTKHSLTLDERAEAFAAIDTALRKEFLVPKPAVAKVMTRWVAFKGLEQRFDVESKKPIATLLARNGKCEVSVQGVRLGDYVEWAHARRIADERLKLDGWDQLLSWDPLIGMCLGDDNSSTNECPMCGT